MRELAEGHQELTSLFLTCGCIVTTRFKLPLPWVLLRGSLVDCERDKPCQVYYRFRVVEGGADCT